MGGQDAARAHLRARIKGVGRGVSRRRFHGVYGAARSGTHCNGWQDVPRGPAGYERAHCKAHRGARLHKRSQGHGQAAGAGGDGHFLRCGHTVRAAPRGAGARAGRRGAEPPPQGGAPEDRFRLRLGSRPRAARPMGSHPNVLVRPSWHRYGAQRMGFNEPRSH